MTSNCAKFFEQFPPQTTNTNGSVLGVIPRIKTFLALSDLHFSKVTDLAKIMIHDYYH